MTGNIEQGNMIRDFFIGNTHIKIYDDFCRNITKPEVDRVLKRIAGQALDEFNKPAVEIHKND